MWIIDYVSVTLQSNYCSFHRAFQWVCWFFWLLSWFVALTDSLGHSVKFKLSLIKFGNLNLTALSLNHLWLIVFDTWTESDWIIRLTSIKCFFFSEQLEWWHQDNGERDSDFVYICNVLMFCFSCHAQCKITGRKFETVNCVSFITWSNRSKIGCYRHWFSLILWNYMNNAHWHFKLLGFYFTYTTNPGVFSSFVVCSYPGGWGLCDRAKRG